MSERVIDVVPGLVRSRKRDWRSIYDRRAKQELVRRCQQPRVSVAATALAHGLNASLLRQWIMVAIDGYVEIVLAAGTIRLHGRVAAETLRIALDALSRRS